MSSTTASPAEAKAYRDDASVTTASLHDSSIPENPHDHGQAQHTNEAAGSQETASTGLDPAPLIHTNEHRSLSATVPVVAVAHSMAIDEAVTASVSDGKRDPSLRSIKVPPSEPNEARGASETVKGEEGDSPNNAEAQTTGSVEADADRQLEHNGETLHVREMAPFATSAASQLDQKEERENIQEAQDQGASSEPNTDGLSSIHKTYRDGAPQAVSAKDRLIHDSDDPFTEETPGSQGEEASSSLTPLTIPPRRDSMANAAAGNGQVINTAEQGLDISSGIHATSDATGAEIQNIMDQFQDGMGGLDEKQIMSPRLERQQSALVLPTRTSSLKSKEPFALDAHGTAFPPQSSASSKGAITGSIGDDSVPRVRAEDQDSITSNKTGSIFQPPPPSPDPEPALPFDFHRFLEQLRHRTADPVARFLRSFLTEFAKKQWMVHEQVKIISDFLEFITKKMGQCEVWRTVSDAEFDNAREGMEKLVMNRLYSQTFSPAIAPFAASPRKSGRSGRSQADAANPHGPGRRGQHQEDVERDDVIAQKIRIYGWIQEQHLDIKPVGDKGKKFLSLAQQELLKINTYRAPRDKVICVLNCCKVIFGFLRSAKADQSADSFVPLLIYTVLRARPEHLVSNVQYIWRFRNQEKLGGEAGYYMSSLMGVVSFIENLDRTNLTITNEEFEKNVEQAVSAIAEKNRAEDYESKSHTNSASVPTQHLEEKSLPLRPDATPQPAAGGERSTARRAFIRGPSETRQSKMAEDDNSESVTGLFKTFQKPLSSIGRMFSDEGGPPPPLKPVSTPLPGSTPRRGLSPNPQLERRSSGDDRSSAERSNTSRRPSQQHDSAEAAAARQASAEASQAQKVQAQEHKVVVE
jgi:hypothetical protein